MAMSSRRFERLVALAIRGLPAPIRARLDNVAIVVSFAPSDSELADQGIGPDDTLFGLYQGTPLTARTTDYGLVLPDKITIYQQPIEESCRSDWAIRREVQATVIHEIAHHFGLSDDDLAALGRD